MRQENIALIVLPNRIGYHVTKPVIRVNIPEFTVFDTSLAMYLLLLIFLAFQPINADSDSYFGKSVENSDTCDGGSCNKGAKDQINVIITFYTAEHKPSLQQKFKVTVHSMLDHSSVNILFHILGDERSQEIAKDILAKHSPLGQKYNVKKLNVDKLAKQLHEIVSPMQDRFSYKPGAYYNHALFFLSIAIHKVMPPDMEKVIMLDCDLKFLADIKELHDRFQQFTDDNIIGIGHDLQPVYRHTFWQYRRDNPGTRVGEPWKKNGLQGFNSGVLLLNLNHMRKSKLYNSLLNRKGVEQMSDKWHFKGHLGDQDFFTLLGMEHEKLFHVLPCQWNRQLCIWWKDKGYEEVFEDYHDCNPPVKIYHGNCDTPIPDGL